MSAALRLVIRESENDGRFALIPRLLTTRWEIDAVDFDDPRALEAGLRHADAVVSMSWNRGMPSAPRVRLLQLPGAGLDGIDPEAVPAQAAICNVYGHEYGIAEYVMAGMLTWVIRLPALDAALRRNSWWGSYLSGPTHGELLGRTLGIVGYGRIGRECARRAKAFGMTVRACSRRRDKGDGLVDEVWSMEDLGRVLEAADFLLLALPLDATTTGLIGAPELARMRSNAVLINVARGTLVDEAALFDACRNRTIGGAILDTWYQYPHPQTPLAAPSAYPYANLENVIMTPHASAWTDGLLERRNRAIARNLDNLARGEPLENLVRLPAGSRTVAKK